MGNYNKVLLAVDFHSDNREIVERAESVVRDNGSELLLIHVNEPLAVAYTADGMATWGDELVSLETSIRKESQKKLADLATRLSVKADNAFLREGRPSSEIHAVAKENGVDLIVLGTHGQHGIQLILGSTANSVLHGAPCDVLCVRVKN
ncbi:MAG: universal stress protein [Gammaproteobacteria bacterium]|nr:universal stress protein [Gammaproteobacteria bacterium]